MGSAGRYYGTYLIYDVANSCLAALHAKMPPPVVVTRTNPPSPVHVQNPRKFSSFLSMFLRLCDWRFVNAMVIADVRFPRFSPRVSAIKFSSLGLFRGEFCP